MNWRDRTWLTFDSPRAVLRFLASVALAYVFAVAVVVGLAWAIEYTTALNTNVQARQRWELVAVVGDGEPVELAGGFHTDSSCREVLQRIGRENAARGAAIGLKCITAAPWWRLALDEMNKP